MKFILSIILAMSFAMPAFAGKYYRTTQEVHRLDPGYKYVIEIESSGFWVGYDVNVEGFLKGSDQKDDNTNRLSEWFWSKPSRDKLIELVDGMHLSVRDAMAERDWDKIHDEEQKKILDELERRMREQFESELQRRMREELEKLKGETDKNKPMEP